MGEATVGPRRLLLLAALLSAAGCAPAALPDRHLAPSPAGGAAETGILPGGVLSDPLTAYSPGWHTRWLAAGGGGWLFTFDDDVDNAHGYVAQLGYGEYFGGGLRFMDFSYEADTGESYDARTLLAFFGAGLGGERPGPGIYTGAGLGKTWMKDDVGREHTDLAGGALLGTCLYRDIKSGNRTVCGLGLAAEVGLFFSDPGDVKLSGATLLLGAYLYF